jgi:hypothetical protein
MVLCQERAWVSNDAKAAAASVLGCEGFEDLAREEEEVLLQALRQRLPNHDDDHDRSAHQNNHKRRHAGPLRLPVRPGQLRKRLVPLEEEVVLQAPRLLL